MNDNFDSVLDDDADFEQSTRIVRTDHHRERFETEDPDRLSQGMQDVGGDGTVFEGGGKNDKFIVIKIN